MSSRSPERSLSRRQILAFAAGAALSPLAARAVCPCGEQLQPVASVPPTIPATQPAGDVLRVCADPNNLPHSNRNQEGFEDRIAALLATELGLKLEYDWLPQRLGFYRTALKTFDSQMVMAAPAGFEKAMLSVPYYRSTYVFVYRHDDAPVKSLDDPRLRSLKIGLPLTGGSNTPPTHALISRNLINNIHGFPVFDESEGRPGEKLIAAVANGEIDVAIAWGPQAGFFARQQKTKLDLSPVTPAEERVGDATLPFTFEICVGVRRSEKSLCQKINEVIGRRQEKIAAILAEYGVPLLPLKPAAHGT